MVLFFMSFLPPFAASALRACCGPRRSAARPRPIRQFQHPAPIWPDYAWFTSYPEVEGLLESILPRAAAFTGPAHWTKSGHLVQWPQSLSRSLLPTNLPLLSRRLQLPVPLGVDFLL